MTPLRVFVLTCREENTDFRRPLASALRNRGIDTYYIWMKRSPVVAGPRESDPPRQMSFPRFLRFLASFTDRDALNIYFNSTNTSFPFITLALRIFAASGIWCFDLHDNLLYDAAGTKWLREALFVKVLQQCSDLVVHAAFTLTELCSHSHHLGNASHIRPVTRGLVDLRKVLITTNLDGRFDFELMEATSKLCPDVEFHIYGQVTNDDHVLRARLQRLCSERKNVQYHGAYVLQELPRILQCYGIAFAPYLAQNFATRYIDPLRYYHCLNSGMEVVTTDIPQARYLGEALHIIRSEGEFSGLMARLQKEGAFRRNVPHRYQLRTWESRVDQLMSIIWKLPRTQSLAKRVDASGHATHQHGPKRTENANITPSG